MDEDENPTPEPAQYEEPEPARYEEPEPARYEEPEPETLPDPADINLPESYARGASPNRSDGSKGASSIKSALRNSSPPPPKSPSLKMEKSPSVKSARSPNMKTTRSPSIKSNKSAGFKIDEEDGGQFRSPAGSNIGKIEEMSKVLTDEANALRESIKSLSQDLQRTKEDLGVQKANVDFPYHLFLLEIIINKIQMKCDCFDFADCNNLVILATFLGKPPIAIYDSLSNGKIENFNKVNIGKSTLFAMTYEKICEIQEFEIQLVMTKQPPCTHCVTRLGETRMDFTEDFVALREELCQQWTKEKPDDNIMCTTSTPLMKNKFYLSCGETENLEAIGVIEVSVRLSFLGKEITTAFSKTPQPRGTPQMMKENNGMTMYSCQNVEMDDGGKVVLDENVMKSRNSYRKGQKIFDESGSGSQTSQTLSPYAQKQSRNLRSKKPMSNGYQDDKYDEISTQMNSNELKIRVPKSTTVDRVSKYDTVNELCECEENPFTGGEQIQFQMPKDSCAPGKEHDTHAQNLTYTYRACDRNCEKKDRKVVNVTPSNCPVPVKMEKELHPNKDVFILKIGKKLESKDKKTELEIELVTPKIPTNNPEHSNVAQQYSNLNLKKKKKDKGKKGAGKKGAGKKGAGKKGGGKKKVGKGKSKIKK